MPLLTDEQIEEAAGKKRHEALDVDDETIVLVQPTRAEFDRWADSDKGSQATRQLALSCLAHPDREAFLKVLDEYPALLRTDVANAIARLSGIGRGKSRRRGA